MSNLVKFEFSDDLSPIEKQAIEKLSNPKIKDTLKKNMVDQLTDAVSRSYVNIGQFKQSEDKKLLETIVDQLIIELKNCFTTYTIEEVSFAIDLGSKGHLNNLQEVIQPIVSVMNILKWIHLYNDKFRREAIHKQGKSIEKQEKKAEELAKSQREQQYIDKIINDFENFPQSFIDRSKGELAAHYRQLDKMGLIKMTEPAKWEVYNQILKIKDRTKWMKKGLLEITAKELAEYRALRITFKGWKEMEIDLKEEIKLTKIS